MAEPMSDERLAEMAKKLLNEINLIALDYGHDDIVSVHYREVGKAAVQVWREQRDAEIERLSNELAKECERADGAARAHDLVAGALADMGKQLTQAEGDLATARGEIGGLHETVAAADADRDRLAGQIEAVRVTACELHDFNSPEGEHVEWCFGCRLERETAEEVPE